MFRAPTTPVAERPELRRAAMPQGHKTLRSSGLRALRSTIYLSGTGRVFQAAHLQQVPLILNHLNVHNIDCAMRFNTFLLVDEALRHGVTAESVLQKITVQRAFTPYQILDALHAVRQAHEQSQQHYNQAVPDTAPTVFFLLAPCKQFFDGDVAEDEAAFLLQKMVQLIHKLQKLAVPLLIAEQEGYSHSAFAPVHKQLLQLAGHSSQIGNHNPDKEKHRNAALQPLSPKPQSQPLAPQRAQQQQQRSQASTLQRENHGPHFTPLLHANRHGTGTLQRVSARTAQAGSGGL